VPVVSRLVQEILTRMKNLLLLEYFGKKGKKCSKQDFNLAPKNSGGVQMKGKRQIWRASHG